MLREIYQMGVFRVRSEFAYQAAVNKNTYNIPVISPSEFAMVDALRREGIFVTSLEKLGIPSTSRLLHASQSLLPKILTTSVSSKKEFMIKATSN